MTGVICAMEIEARGLIALMKNKKKVVRLGYVFTQGKIDDKDVTVVLCGIGKVNAAAVTALLISDLGADRVINLGVCGGNCGTGKLILADSVVQYDYDTTAFGSELGQLDGFDSPFIKCTLDTSGIECDHRGVIASGDKFVDDPKEAKRLAERFGAIGFDMESGAVAQICTKAGVKFAVVRVVSDGGDATEYERFKIIAAQKGIACLLQLLRKEN